MVGFNIGEIGGGSGRGRRVIKVSLMWWWWRRGSRSVVLGDGGFQSWVGFCREWVSLCSFRHEWVLVMGRFWLWVGGF